MKTIRPLWLQLALLVVAALFAAHAIELAIINVSPGSPDSVNNLATARNIVEGQGYTTGVVHQYFTEQSLPGPETVRPPGIPYLVALCFWLFGESLAIPPLINVVLLLGTALLLRSGLRNLGVGWGAEIGALLALLTSYYQPLSIANNTALNLCTICLFWAGSLHISGRLGLKGFAVLAGTIASLGFFMKPTFVFTAVPASAVLLWFSPQAKGCAGRFARPGYVVLFLGTLALISAPYWVNNLMLFGDPLYNPMRGLRVLARYGGEHGRFIWPSGTWATVRLGQPLTVGELLDAKGVGWLLARELQVISMSLIHFWKHNPYVILLAALGVISLVQQRSWLILAFSVLLMGESLFSLMYISVAARYLWPAYYCLVVLGCLGLRDVGPRKRWLVVPLLALALGTGAFNAYKKQSLANKLAQAGESEDWVELVRREVPEDAVVLSNDPWRVWWAAERSAITIPMNGRDAIKQVLHLYRPTHFLYFGTKRRDVYAINDSDLELVTESPEGAALFRIQPGIYEEPVPPGPPDTPLQIREMK